MRRNFMENLISLKEAYEYTGLSRGLFNSQIRPEVPHFRFGRTVLFNRDDLDAFFIRLEAHHTTPAPIYENDSLGG